MKINSKFVRFNSTPPLSRIFWKSSIRIHSFTIRIGFGNSNCIVVCSALKYCLLKNTCEIVFFLFVLPLLVTKLNFVQSNIPFFSVHNISWLWICRMKLLGLLVLNQGTWKWKMPMYLIKLEKTVGNWLEFTRAELMLSLQNRALLTI